jgi:hypothetical protein
VSALSLLSKSAAACPSTAGRIARPKLVSGEAIQARTSPVRSTLTNVSSSLTASRAAVAPIGSACAAVSVDSPHAASTGATSTRPSRATRVANRTSVAFSISAGSSPSGSTEKSKRIRLVAPGPT